MATGFEGLTFVVITLNLIANHQSACWTSSSGEANRTTSFAKSVEAVRVPSPFPTLSFPKLHLEILCMKIIKISGGYGQPWWNPMLAKDT